MSAGQKVSIGKEEAIRLYDGGWWKGMTARQICEVQLFTEELCMPFDEFQSAMSHCLGRPVFTHEFGLNYDGLVAEFLGQRPAPTLDQIVGLLNSAKTVLINI